MEIINSTIYIITISSSIFFAILVFIKNKKSPLNISFSLYTFSIISWIITLFLFYRADEASVLLIGRLNFAATEIIAFLGFYFGYYFPVRTFRLNKITHVALFVWLFFIVNITIWTDLIDKEEIIKSTGIETVFGDYYLIFILHKLRAKVHGIKFRS